jgi:predicted nucleic-acid-binding protein
MSDDASQANIAKTTVKAANTIVLTLPTLCEYAWVLGRGYKLSRKEIAENIRELLEVDGVIVDRQAVNDGLAMLDANGDFADGVIAHLGRWHDAPLVSFDSDAIKLLKKQGHPAVQL